MWRTVTARGPAGAQPGAGERGPPNFLGERVHRADKVGAYPAAAFPTKNEQTP